MENLRLDSLDKEAAVSQERNLLARELHDSIAQSLAFLKIQVQLMRDALASGNAGAHPAVLGEIDAGVRESYGDVRELLLHFRTRANAEDIEPALQTTLRKFEHQSGLQASLQMQGQGLPLAPDLQIQVLHILQEALSNVRKHARAQPGLAGRAAAAALALRGARRRHRLPDRTTPAADETHVGLRIMPSVPSASAPQLEVMSTPGRGTSVVLTLAAAPCAAPARRAPQASRMSMTCTAP